MQDTGSNETTATTAPSATITASIQSAYLSQNSTTTTIVAASGESIGIDDITPTGDTAGSMNVLSINQTAFQARMHIEEACTAIQNNDTQGALTDLNLAEKSIDNTLNNLTSKTTTGGAN